MAEILLYIVIIGLVVAFFVVDQMSNRVGKNNKRMQVWSNILFVPMVVVAAIIGAIIIFIFVLFTLYGLATRQ